MEAEEFVSEFKSTTRTKLDNISGNMERSQRDIHKLFEELRDLKKSSVNSNTILTLTSKLEIIESKIS
jgi:hypothetical protein